MNRLKRPCTSRLNSEESKFILMFGSKQQRMTVTRADVAADYLSSFPSHKPLLAGFKTRISVSVFATGAQPLTQDLHSASRQLLRCLQ